MAPRWFRGALLGTADVSELRGRVSASQSEVLCRFAVDHLELEVSAELDRELGSGCQGVRLWRIGVVK